MVSNGYLPRRPSHSWRTCLVVHQYRGEMLKIIPTMSDTSGVLLDDSNMINSELTNTSN